MALLILHGMVQVGKKRINPFHLLIRQQTIFSIRVYFVVKAPGDFWEKQPIRCEVLYNPVDTSIFTPVSFREKTRFSHFPDGRKPSFLLQGSGSC